MHGSDEMTELSSAANIALAPMPNGNSNQNVDPSPAFERIPKRPPLNCTIRRTRASPSPVPLPPKKVMSKILVCPKKKIYLAGVLVQSD